MKHPVKYSFCTTRANHVSWRSEVEKGETDDWRIIRRRMQELAAERKVIIYLYTYNEYFCRWDYIGKTLPNGDHYDFNDSGPYALDDDANGYHKKKNTRIKDIFSKQKRLLTTNGSASTVRPARFRCPSSRACDLRALQSKLTRRKNETLKTRI